MVAQQEVQRELWEEIRHHQEKGRIAVEEAHRASRIPKPMLQKFTSKDDIESYLGMFESLKTARVASGRYGLHNVQVCSLEMLLTAILLFPQIDPRDYDYVKTTILRRYEVTNRDVPAVVPRSHKGAD